MSLRAATRLALPFARAAPKAAAAQNAVRSAVSAAGLRRVAVAGSERLFASSALRLASKGGRGTLFEAIKSMLVDSKQYLFGYIYLACRELFIGGSTADKDLVAKLKEEHQYELENDEDAGKTPEFVESFKKEGTWKV